MTEVAVRLRHQSRGSGPTCRRILGALPTWFGIPQSVEDYVAVADQAPTIVASLEGEDVGFEFLQVKTLSASHPDAGYQKTRAFYLACGFRPLQEFRELWDAEQPALQMVKVVAALDSPTCPDTS